MILRFFFDYMRSRFQESISYELVAKDRLAIGDALKRVSLITLRKKIFILFSRKNCHWKMLFTN